MAAPLAALSTWKALAMNAWEVVEQNAMVNRYAQSLGLARTARLGMPACKTIGLQLAINMHLLF